MTFELFHLLEDGNLKSSSIHVEAVDILYKIKTPTLESQMKQMTTISYNYTAVEAFSDQAGVRGDVSPPSIQHLFFNHNVILANRGSR